VDREEIVAALTALGRGLAGRGVTGELYAVGGAAMALAYAARRSTRDIDAVFEPKRVIYEEAARVAEDLGLPAGWLNDAVKGFLFSDDPEAAEVLDVPGLRCFAASPRILLALKCLAHRVGEDEDDVRLLARLLGLTSGEQVIAEVERVVGRPLDTAGGFFIQELFAPGAGGPTGA